MAADVSLRAMGRDERGAILVAGIFMCTCLVGALWYIAGVGDAILYRERLQEAADATAFSIAAVHARGMNLIVVLNLIMAIVLSVRVILKIAQLILIGASVAFTGLGIIIPPFLSAAGWCARGAQMVDRAITTTRSPINNTLKSLSKAQIGIAKATPALATAGSVYVGMKYADGRRVAGAIAAPGEVGQLMEGLPTEEGSADKLCKEAGRAVPELIGWVIWKSTKIGDPKARNTDEKTPGGWLSAAMGGLAGSSSQLFCEMGSATGAASVPDALFEEPATEYCKDPEASEAKRVANAEQVWQDACAKAGVVCGGRDARGEPAMPGWQRGTTSMESQQELDRLRALRNEAIQLRVMLPLRAMSWELSKVPCAEFEMDRMKKEFAARQREMTSKDAHSNGDGMTPKQVNPEFWNGAEGAQLFGLAFGDKEVLQRSSKLVRVAAADDGESVKKASVSDVAMIPSWSQAEFFFDCNGSWSGEDCNGDSRDQDAMWHIKWRPRLRRFDGSTSLGALFSIAATVGAGYVGVDAFTQVVSGLSANAAYHQPGLFVESLQMKQELFAAIARDRNRRHGVH